MFWTDWNVFHVSKQNSLFEIAFMLWIFWVNLLRNMVFLKKKNPWIHISREDSCVKTHNYSLYSLLNKKRKILIFFWKLLKLAKKTMNWTVFVWFCQFHHNVWFQAFSQFSIVTTQIDSNTKAISNTRIPL
jgi:hypothetical protein